MKKGIITVLCGLYAVQFQAQLGKVGINTTSPQAMLHVSDSAVVFTGFSPLISEAITPPPPVSGAGSRMMWYPGKSAFRVGTIGGNEWDKSFIGRYSFACGQNSYASGGYATAMGQGSVASGIASFAIGSGSDALFDYSYAIGVSALTMANNSISIGTTTKTAGTYATSMGAFTVSHAYNCFTIGRYNDSISTGALPTLQWQDTDPLFIIGNGTAPNARRNAFIVAKNGETGINVANGMPQALLHLKAKEATYNMHIRLENVSSSDYASIVYDGDMKFRTFGAGDVYQWRNSTNNTRMALDDLGNLTIAGIYSPSDARLKKNIFPLQNSLQKVINLNGYHYNWIDKTSDASLQTGLLAQEVEKQMPELVKTNEEGVKSVNYNGMIPYLVEAMKQQQQKIESLEKELIQIRELLMQNGNSQ